MATSSSSNEDEDDDEEDDDDTTLWKPGPEITVRPTGVVRVK